MQLISYKIKNPDNLNLILGQSHFIKTAQDVYEAMVNSIPGAQFGVAFCEASIERLVRTEGTSKELADLAGENALAIGAGHSFIVFLKDCFPINVLNSIKQVPEVCRIYCATANPVEVILTQTEQGRAILGVVDGFSPVGIESPEKAVERRELVRRFGYKL